MTRSEVSIVSMYWCCKGHYSLVNQQIRDSLLTNLQKEDKALMHKGDHAQQISKLSK